MKYWRDDKQGKTAAEAEEDSSIVTSHQSPMYELRQDGRAVAVTSHKDQVIGPPPWRSRAQAREAMVWSTAGKGVNRPVDQFHRVQGDELPKYDLPQGQDYEAQERKSREDEAAHAENVRVAEAYWKEKTRERTGSVSSLIFPCTSILE